jgi:WD40 repeat protein
VHQTADGFDVLVHGCNQIWNLGSPEPNFTLEAHQKGVNCVEYFSGGDRPYLITGSDDQTAKVTFMQSGPVLDSAVQCNYKGRRFVYALIKLMFNVQ